MNRENKVSMEAEEIGRPKGYLAYSATGTKQVGAKTFYSYRFVRVFQKRVLSIFISAVHMINTSIKKL